MSISQQFEPAHFTADGLERQWPFTFQVPDGSLVVGYVTSPTGSVSKITENMSVDLQNKKYIYPTVASGLSPLASGWKITLMRQTPCTQEIDLDEQDNVPYASMEEGLDKLTYLAQETKEEVSRAIKFSCTAETVNTDAQSYLNTVQGFSAAAASSAQSAQNSALTAAQYAANAQQDVSGLAADLTALSNTVSANQVTDQTYANTVASNALTVAEAYCDAKIATEISARQSADETLQTAINTKQAAGDYATNTALTNGLALKQNVLSSSQQAAVDSGVTSDTVSQVSTNTQHISAITAELEAAKPWKKPSGWVDIRFGAQNNSVYALVGHKADFSKYNIFPIRATVNNSGTYDIYIDGVKQYSAVASGTTTTINWQTLNLASGFDVTYPEALKTHIIRLTPTVNTNKLNYPKFISSDVSDTDGSGLLWVHFTTDYAVGIANMCYASGPRRSKILEAVTCSTDTLKCGWSAQAFLDAYSLTTIPTLEISEGDADQSAICYNTKIKRFECKLTAALGSTRTSNTNGLPECEEIVNEGQYGLHCTSFENCPKLKRIVGPWDHTFGENYPNLFGGDVSMEDLFLDFSDGSQVKRMVIGGTSSVPLPWFKGLLVSASAPFDHTTSPQLSVAYTGMERGSLVTLFASLPTVTDDQVCDVTGASGAADLTTDDLAVATAKGWTVTR